MQVLCTLTLTLSRQGRGKNGAFQSLFLGLTSTYIISIIVCMRTTLIIRDDILKRAVALTGTHGKTALVHAGLEALIEKKARERLAALGGSAPHFRAGRRRR